jgi:hypothetical protein
MHELNSCLPLRLVTSELSRHAAASVKEVANTQAHAKAGRVSRVMCVLAVAASLSDAPPANDRGASGAAEPALSMSNGSAVLM